MISSADSGPDNAFSESARQRHTRSEDARTISSGRHVLPPVWPEEALQRRQNMSNLLNSYYHQIRHGCSNLQCKTSTCCTYQQRVSKSPFRTYTSLSARTLAGYLASQDHSQKVLCPDLYRDPLKTSGPHASNRKKTKPRVPGPLLPPFDELPTPAIISQVLPHLERDDEYELEGCYAQDDSEQRKKDPRSFTQCLFNTNAMRQLFLGGLPIDDLKRRSPGRRDQLAKLAVLCSADSIESASESLIAPPGLQCVVGRSPIITSSEANADLLISTCQVVKTPGTSTHSLIPKTMIDKHCFFGPPILWLLPIRPRFLSHFTCDNVEREVNAIMSGLSSSDRSILLANKFGRTDHPVPMFSCLRSGEHRHCPESRFSHIAQSNSYILSRTDALLRSFIVCQIDEHNPITLWSSSFVDMISAFRALHEVDLHPRKIFSSLWRSVGKIYVAGLGRAKRSTQGRSLLATQDSNADDRLDDAEASHIIKIIFAALVGSLQWDRETLRMVQRFRPRGLIHPGNSFDGIPHTCRSKVLTLVRGLENNQAIDLVIRLVRAWSTRRHLAGAPTHRALKRPLHQQEDTSSPPDLFELTIRNLVNPTSMKMTPAEYDGSPPTIKGATLHEFHGTDLSLHSEEQRLDPMFLEIVIEWLRTVILKEWDGRAEVVKSSAVGGTLEFMACFYKHYALLGMDPQCFQIPFLSQRLDVLEVPSSWLNSRTSRNVVHLLDFPFLFPQSALVLYIRAINHAAMYKAFEDSMVNARLLLQMNFSDSSTGRGVIRMTRRLRRELGRYNVLEIRREDILTDAFDQIWRRERRELRRPLKVRMGAQEGEEGVDHGGVQQEFFRVAIAEALDPKYGAFTTDPVTQMTWFQPSSLEPLYKFELIGILFSLAMYNGLTLPCTLPLALYRKLLKLPVERLSHLEDGWPDLVKGLEALRDWADEDVEHVFARIYVFSYDVFGTTKNVDLDATRRQDRKASELANAIFEIIPAAGDGPLGHMNTIEEDTAEFATGSTAELYSNASNDQCNDQPTTKPSYIPTRTQRSDSITSDTSMVTNANRHQYIQDYIDYLANTSVAPQYSAFARGFTALVSSKTLSLLTPSNLKNLVEGYAHINTYDLQSITTYEGGYHRDHPSVIDFWTIVHGWAEQGGEKGQSKVRGLLEFVTASDRLPVTGTARLVFVVQKNGEGDARLPTSLTCFGRLLLPQYSEFGKLRGALEKAIEHSKGFGQP